MDYVLYGWFPSRLEGVLSLCFIAESDDPKEILNAADDAWDAKRFSLGTPASDLLQSVERDDLKKTLNSHANESR